MSQQRACDVCGMYRQDRTHRYGLSRQVPVPGRFRPNRPHSIAFKRERHFGGIDLCDECWERIAVPKKRRTHVA